MKKSWGDLLEGSVVHRAVEQNLPRMGFVGDNLQFIEGKTTLEFRDFDHCLYRLQFGRVVQVFELVRNLDESM